MSVAIRFIAALGGLLVAASFFLPWDFHNTPMRLFLWSLEGWSQDGVSKLESVGIAWILLYSYLWAAWAAITIGWREGVRLAWVFKVHLAFHVAGGGVLALFGALLLATGDEGMLPRPVQWVAVFVPIVFLLCLGIGAWWAGPRRRIPLVMSLALMLQIPVQTVLAWKVYEAGGPVWGFATGAVGALLGMTGAACVFLLEGVPEKT